MNILIVAATAFEIAPLLQHLENNWTKEGFSKFTNDENSIDILVTGVGMVHTTFALSRYSGYDSLDIAINLGIAGTFTDSLAIGSVVEVVQDRFSDLGIQQKDGAFTDIFELELHDKNLYPYYNGWIKNEPLIESDLIKVHGITVNKVHGEQNAIEQVKSKYSAHIESMEGAAFFYTSRMSNIKCHQFRSISNKVEPRNKDNWDIPLAISNLNDYIIKLIHNI